MSIYSKLFSLKVMKPLAMLALCCDEAVAMDGLDAREGGAGLNSPGASSGLSDPPAPAASAAGGDGGACGAPVNPLKSLSPVSSLGFDGLGGAKQLPSSPQAAAGAAPLAADGTDSPSLRLALMNSPMAASPAIDAHHGALDAATPNASVLIGGGVADGRHGAGAGSARGGRGGSSPLASPNGIDSLSPRLARTNSPMAASSTIDARHDCCHTDMSKAESREQQRSERQTTFEEQARIIKVELVEGQEFKLCDVGNYTAEIEGDPTTLCGDVLEDEEKESALKCQEGDIFHVHKIEDDGDITFEIRRRKNEKVFKGLTVVGKTSMTHKQWTNDCHRFEAMVDWGDVFRYASYVSEHVMTLSKKLDWDERSDKMMCFHAVSPDGWKGKTGFAHHLSLEDEDDSEARKLAKKLLLRPVQRLFFSSLLAFNSILKWVGVIMLLVSMFAVYLFYADTDDYIIPVDTYHPAGVATSDERFTAAKQVGKYALFVLLGFGACPFLAYLVRSVIMETGREEKQGLVSILVWSKAFTFVRMALAVDGASDIPAWIYSFLCGEVLLCAYNPLAGLFWIPFFGGQTGGVMDQYHLFGLVSWHLVDFSVKTFLYYYVAKLSSNGCLFFTTHLGRKSKITLIFMSALSHLVADAVQQVTTVLALTMGSGIPAADPSSKRNLASGLYAWCWRNSDDAPNHVECPHYSNWVWFKMNIFKVLKGVFCGWDSMFRAAFAIPAMNFLATLVDQGTKSNVSPLQKRNLQFALNELNLKIETYEADQLGEGSINHMGWSWPHYVMGACFVALLLVLRQLLAWKMAA